MRKTLPVFLVLVTLWGCSDDYLIDLGPQSIPRAGTWLIDESLIQWGCPGQDCIPSLTRPPLVEQGSGDLAYLDDGDLVVGVKKGDTAVAFPHPILDWHEVVNMEGYTISYCPLTGSAVHVQDDRGFGVSGLLYNSNLIMYDRESNSYWPQMFLMAASGKFRGEDLTVDRMMETTWKTWRKLFPETQVLSSKTGYSRNYQAYPYGSFRTDGNIYFPVSTLDSRLHPKERVLGILANGEAKAYVVDDFDSVGVIHEEVGNENYVIVGSGVDNFAVAYRTDKTFELSSYDLDSGSILLRDEETGSQWNLLGEAISGQLQGQRLETGKSFISYWFAWAAFYPDTGIWSRE
ncbi:MAG: DUF3179 domain-containing protein [Fidelibacterota bacterium]